MISLLSIIKLTCKAAFRSHIFQLLLFVLIVCVIALPSTIAGDGTAYGYIQISLKYNLGVVAFMLSMSTIWLSCFIMTQDLESYQLHMVVSKPVSRLKIWMGKCAGVLMINITLLLISCALVYVIVMWQFKRKDFDKDKSQKSKIENEVLVGRRVFYPKLPDLNEQAKKEYQKRVATAKTFEKGLNSQEAKQKVLKEIKKQILASMSEVRYGPRASRLWEYEGLPTKLDKKTPLYLRFRTYIGKVSSKEQRETYGLWRFKATVENKNAEAEKGPEKLYKSFWVQKSYFPEKIMCGIFNEFKLPRQAISPQGAVDLSFTNFDPQKKTLFFQVADGPKLMIKVTGFFSNYCRAVLMIMMQLALLAGISCSAASFLSMPTAVFIVVSYMLFGIFASYLVGAGVDTPGLGFGDYLAYYVSKALLLIIIPMQKFEVSHLISNGELIEYSYMGAIFLKYFICRGAPIFLLGIWLYWRRELGLVVRK
jgi:hypothetical protein